MGEKKRMEEAQEKAEERTRLAAKFGNSQIGGEGTMRRKKKVQHKTNVVDDKKLNAVMRRMNMQQIPGVEEINIIKDDNTVIHFTKPQLKGSIRDNSYVVSGNCETFKNKNKIDEKDEDDIPDLEEGTFEDYDKK